MSTSPEVEIYEAINEYVYVSELGLSEDEYKKYEKAKKEILETIKVNYNNAEDYLARFEKDIEKKKKYIENPPDWLKEVILPFLLSKELEKETTEYFTEDLLKKLTEAIVPFQLEIKLNENLKELIYQKTKAVKGGIMFFDSLIKLPLREKIAILDFIYNERNDGGHIDTNKIAKIIKEEDERIETKEIGPDKVFSLKNLDPNNEIYNFVDDIGIFFGESYGPYRADFAKNDLIGYIAITRYSRPVVFSFLIPSNVKSKDEILKYIEEKAQEKKDGILLVSKIIDVLTRKGFKVEGFTYNYYATSEDIINRNKIEINAKKDNNSFTIFINNNKVDISVTNVNPEIENVSKKYTFTFNNLDELFNIFNDMENLYDKIDNDINETVNKIKERKKNVKFDMYLAFVGKAYSDYLYTKNKIIDENTWLYLSFGRSRNDINKIAGRLYNKYAVSSYDASSSFEKIVPELYADGKIKISNGKVLLDGTPIEEYLKSSGVEVENEFIEEFNTAVKSLAERLDNKIIVKFLIKSMLENNQEITQEFIERVIRNFPAGFWLEEINNKPIFDYMPDNIKKYILTRMTPEERVFFFVSHPNKDVVEPYREIVEKSLTDVPELDKNITAYLYEYHKDKAYLSIVSLYKTDYNRYYLSSNKFNIIVNKVLKNGEISFIFFTPQDVIGIAYNSKSLKDAYRMALDTYKKAVNKVKKLHLGKNKILLNFDKITILLPIGDNGVLTVDEINKAEQEVENEYDFA